MRETCTSGSVGALGSNPQGDPTVSAPKRCAKPRRRDFAPEWGVSGLHGGLASAAPGRDHVNLELTGEPK
jgi:hypothetical protein